MVMTREEIIRDYRQAADKTNQIVVLSELNLCKKQEIAEILMEAGMEVPKYYLGQKKSREARAAREANGTQAAPPEGTGKPGPAQKPQPEPPKQGRRTPPELRMTDLLPNNPIAAAAIDSIEDAMSGWTPGEDGTGILLEIAGVLRMYRKLEGAK